MGSEFSRAHGRPVTAVTADYYAVLSRAVEASKSNPGQLRHTIYDMARANLRRELVWQNPSIPDAELTDHLAALEAAIKRVEAAHSDDYDNLVFRPSVPANDEPHIPEAEPEPEPVPEYQAYVEPPPVRPVDLDEQRWTTHEPEPQDETYGALVVLPPEPPMAMQHGTMLQPAPQIVVDYHPPSREFADPPPPPNRIRNSVGSFVQLTAAALLAVVIFAVMTGQLNIRWIGNKQQQQAAAVAPAPMAPALAPAAAPIAASPEPVAPTAPALPFPMPPTYGVYALNNDKLFELERLGMRVPDSRVPISAEIRDPSRVSLPDGRVSFVVFRRDLVSGAPEKVQVRVVAKVAREMTFTDGKAKTSAVDNLWRIRSNAFDFKVAPVNDNRELIAIRPDADLVLPAGRYALVLNGLGYDFTVAGPVTSPLQCLERIETVGGGMYSECRNP